MFSALDVSTSGLTAQRVRMNVISSNLANISSTRNEDGELDPYRERFVIFQADESVGSSGAAGVRVNSVEISEVEPRYEYDPGNPDHITEGPWEGYVAYPNINMMTQFTDALEAARAYEANLGSIEISKDLYQQTLRILA